MSIFAVLTEANNPKLEAVVKEKFPDDHYMLAPNQWLISAKGTAQKLTEDLLIIDKEKGPGSAIVFNISSYYGMANPAVWEWIKEKWEQSDG